MDEKPDGFSLIQGFVTLESEEMPAAFLPELLTPDFYLHTFCNF